MENFWATVIITALISGFFGTICGAITSESKSCGRKVVNTMFFVALAIAGTIALFVAYAATGSVFGTVAIVVFMGFAAYVPIFFFDALYTEQAEQQFKYCADACQWGLTNFDRIAIEGAESFSLVDIDRVLRNQNTQDADRRMLGFFRCHITDVGKEVEVFRMYNVQFGAQVVETPDTVQLFGISRGDLTSYPTRLRERPEVGGWLKSGTATTAPNVP